MNNIKFLLAFVFFVTLFIEEGYSHGTFTDTTIIRNIDSSKLEKISADLKDLKEILSKIKTNEKDEKQFIGVIKLANDSAIKIYEKDDKKQQKLLATTTDIARVTMDIKDGYILDINVYTKNGKETYTNTRAPIAITSRRFSDTDRIRGIHNYNNFIILKDFLEFETRKSYLPEDGFIELKSDKKSDSLFRNVGVNTVLDLRLYTDALSLFGKEANGIAQTDLRIKHILHRINVHNRGGFLGHYLKFNLNAAKFDSKNNFVDSAKFSRTEFLQKSWMNAEIAYNLLSTWIVKKSTSTFYWDIGAGINASKLAFQKDTVNVIGQNLFTEIGLNLRSSDNIGLDLTARLTANYSPQTTFVEGNKAEKILRFGAEAFFNPLNDKAGRIFGRINYMMSTISTEKKNNFFQVQLGYSILLSKAIKSGS